MLLLRPKMAGQCSRQDSEGGDGFYKIHPFSLYLLRDGQRVKLQAGPHSQVIPACTNENNTEEGEVPSSALGLEKPRAGRTQKLDNR